MLTSEQISEAKKRTVYRWPGEIRHEHDDCIRMAYEWLDAQNKTHGKFLQEPRSIKHKIERWCCRYISTHDVEVAATLHPKIKGTYPYFNISPDFVRPSMSRLDGIAQAFAHEKTYGGDGYNPDTYTFDEGLDPSEFA